MIEHRVDRLKRRELLRCRSAALVAIADRARGLRRGESARARGALELARRVNFILIYEGGQVKSLAGFA